jgi:hypothetical protein
MHKLLLILITLVLFITPAKANKGITEYIKNPKLVGQASYNYIFWHIYDVYLYAENGLYSSDKPFALMLIYKRDLEGNDIALRSKQEIQKIGFKDKAILERWYQKMIDIFPDVSNGSELVGVYTKDKRSIFFDENKKIGEESDPDFGKWFFGIWLSEKNLYPKLNKQLLGSE